MVLRTPESEAGAAGLTAILEQPQEASLAFDFDGVLSPIVADPGSSRPYPGVVAALGRLAELVGSVSIITGRPVADVLRLGDLGELAALEHFSIYGVYGMQRWDWASRSVVSEPVPAGVAAARAELPALLDAAGFGGVSIEDKAMSVAVHTRRADAPQEAFAALREPLNAVAARHGLAVEPGRMVLELRPPGIDKGHALESVVAEHRVRAVAYFGDDLGDLAAFDAVERLRETGVFGLKVCSGSDEVPRLAERADLIVDGPPGVLEFVESLNERLK
ncbi:MULTISPECIES: trehalose-phosphatase [Dactylosporangium]|uniref:Trehalose 6-phosphate phosphatase n=2 Tax=Dactylosporangium TaxID=35753 RepID=A0A9W6KNU6_9ACTN|nr:MULTISPECIES: trehalose-phosphatase [Dactylosporangium]UAB94365.1 trehalose-phosphatase [Dactylosporangium vinaceum]UWZ42762.1 trehalose-phosphatase [Dactylosporangium matsuzakiense]GLL05417.1 trehalose 6-phosphate phosphatase [Dactylosporangium matsuzakiense]